MSDVVDAKGGSVGNPYDQANIDFNQGLFFTAPVKVRTSL